LAVSYESLSIDVHLQLLSGQAMYVEGIGNVKPKTLREIVEVGYSKFLEYLNIFTLEVRDFIKDEYLDQVDIPLFHVILAFDDDTFQTHFKEAIEFFIEKKVIISRENFTAICYEDENFYLDSNNFSILKNVIKWQNGILQTTDKKDLKFKNDRAKKIFERLNKTKEQVDKLKKKEEGDLDLADIVSAIGSKSFSLNKLNVFDLTLYQLYDEFKRLDLIDNYHTSLKAVMAGAQKVNVNHWTSNIKD
jgi:hypothetical protein